MLQEEVNMRSLVSHFFLKPLLKAKLLNVGALTSLPMNRLWLHLLFTKTAIHLIRTKSFPEGTINPSISIIVIHHDPSRLSWLIECMYSLQSQIYSDFKIILVVNYEISTDTRILLSKFKNIRIERFENSHPSQARNFGLQNCDSTLTLFVDDDNLLLPWHVMFFVNAYKTNPHAAIYFGSYLTFNNQKVTNFPLRYFVNRKTLLLGDPTDVSSIAIQKKFINRIQWDDEVLSENWALLVDVFERNLRVHQMFTPLSLHRDHQESRTFRIERPLIPNLWFEKYRNKVNWGFQVPKSLMKVKVLKIIHSFRMTSDL